MTSRITALKDERTLVWALIWTCVIMCVLYIFFMNETVFNVAKRASFEQDIAARASEISDLEFSYITAQNDIDMNLAYQLGYKDVTAPQYISNTSVTARLSQNTI